MLGHVEPGCTGGRKASWWAVFAVDRLAASADAAGLLRLVGFVSFAGRLLSSSITAAGPGFKYLIGVSRHASEIIRSWGSSGILERLRRLVGSRSLGRGGKRRHGCRTTEQSNEVAIDDSGGLLVVCKDWADIHIYSDGKICAVDIADLALGK